MSDPRTRLVDAAVVRTPGPRRPVGKLLIEAGIISQDDLHRALELQRKVDARIGDILVAEGHATEADILDALSIQNHAERVNLALDPPSLNMAPALPSDVCIKHEIVPWRWLGDTLMVATTRPYDIRTLRDQVGTLAPPLLPVIAPQAQIHAHLGRLYGNKIAQRAITRLEDIESARSWSHGTRSRAIGAVIAVLCLTLALITFPTQAFSALLVWALLTLALTTSLKAAAFLTQLFHQITHPPRPLPTELPFKLPRVSMIVPLYKEKEIAAELVKRLEKLSYPKSLLNVFLVLEAKDEITRTTLARTQLPPWISVLEVPDVGTITTKPRALNYALEFCHGSIVGVWDAEDAPEPNQIEKVVIRFNEAPERVACLQGQLDYYNSRTNWIARCFAIEYATWWRMVMPGMSRLGMPIPLGGTTLFFRKSILDELGGWDAHNVTEDADLGVRLARRGYKTELLSTVTGEEANCRPWPWIRQRSRWLKGFLITYCVHMRRPRRLLKDLGLKGFLGFQIIFLATFSQFAALPLLWTLWFPLVGLPHIMLDTLGYEGLRALALFLLASELLNILIGASAVTDSRHRHLMIWVVTLPVYFTMGALAAYKALYEIILMPFYWDKTQHGVTISEAEAMPPPDGPPHPASDGS